MRSNTERDCWGTDIQLNARESLNTRAPLCTGKVEPGSLYVRRPDSRIQRAGNPTPYDWCVCMWCATHYHSDILEGDFLEWIALSQEEIELTKERAQNTVKELVNLGVPGGAWSI